MCFRLAIIQQSYKYILVDFLVASPNIMYMYIHIQKLLNTTDPA